MKDGREGGAWQDNSLGSYYNYHSNCVKDGREGGAWQDNSLGSYYNSADKRLGAS